MDAVLLALGSAFLFGAMTITLRVALRRGVEADVVSFLMVLVALGVAVAAIPLTGATSFAGCWPFLLAGLIAPGGSQILFAYAVRDAGPARASVAVSMAPLVSVAIALLLLGEPAKPLLLAGAVFIVLGGVALATETGRPAHVRMLGMVFALGTMVLFATRDSLIRKLSIVADVEPAVAATSTLASGTAVGLGYLLVARRPRTLRPFRLGPLGIVAPTGLCYGLSYVLLFEAFYRGRVSVVSPLVATESLWTVVLASIFLRGHELVNRRVVLGALLVVTGGALIGAVR
jgi:drug/metabolite transporter (DMT)-like permease